jgi:hypothetical protein
MSFILANWSQILGFIGGGVLLVTLTIGWALVTS